MAIACSGRPTQIKAVIFANAEEWLKTYLPDLTSDSVCSIQRISEYDFNGTTRFVDNEEYDPKHPTHKDASMVDFVLALGHLCEQIDNGKLHVGGLTAANQLVDPCNWDAEVVDAYRQLVYHGEVIYG